MPKRLFVTVLCAMICSAANSETVTKTWTDTNYVPCEGMGLSASGTIELTVYYEKHVPPESPGLPSVPPYYLVGAIFVNTKYLHNWDPHGSITFTNTGNFSETRTLQKPWYTTVGTSNAKLLVGERIKINPGNFPVHRQQPFDVALNSPINLRINVRFPQQGGNCFSSFSKDFTLQ
jgi:hypothetical protein